MKAVIRTDIGKIRSHNEDYAGVFFNKGEEMLAIVADGMGGHLAGDIASQMASQLLQERWEKTEPLQKKEEAIEWFRNHLNQVNVKLFQHAKENPECTGMGTTIVAAIILDSFAVIAHVGDSRCYIANEKGIRLLTEDHSLVNELVKTGQISKEDAEHHPRKNVLLRAMGTEERVEHDIVSVAFEKGNYLLLCSDGLSNKLSENQIQEIILEEGKSLEEKADLFIRLANELGGEDNITLVMIENSQREKAGDENVDW